MKGTSTKTVTSVNGKRQRPRENLELALAQIEKAFGRGAVMRMTEAEALDRSIDTIPTGSIALDLALGVGGLPPRTIVEIFGAESAGKSDPRAARHCRGTEKGWHGSLHRRRNALDPTYAKALGVQVEKLLISQPDSAEQALEITDYLVRSGALDIVVIDSVAALVPRAELEGEMGDVHMGLQARLMSQALRKLSGSINKTSTVVVFINQLREKVGVIFGNPEVTPGGRALKFYSSVRIDLRRAESIKVGTDIIGNRVRARVVKNKVAPPFKKVELEIIYNEGISKEGALLDLGVERGVLSKRGSFFSFGETRIGQGREGLPAVPEGQHRHPGRDRSFDQRNVLACGGRVAGLHAACRRSKEAWQTRPVARLRRDIDFSL